MPVYTALLRGINVSGHKIIKMDRLKSIFESLEYQHVRTYIQSGNVIFQSSESQEELLRETIEAELRSSLGYDIPVVVRSQTELEETIRRNPFPKILENESVYVSFLYEEPSAEAVDHLLSYKNDADDFVVMHREVYILCRKNYGTSLLSKNFLEKKLGVYATTRNWNTVNKLATLCKL
ncbi:DUF1697 domain-containing protein [Paenibacillus tarimensis]